MIDSKAKAWTLKGSPRKFRIGALKKAQTLAGANRKWIVTDDGRPFIVDDHHDSILVRGMKDGKLAGTMIYGTPARAFTYKPGAIALNKFRFNNETNIDHLSSKLIIINGKEASEHDLKKLSAADIESMSVRSGEEMTKKYGEKAREGVLFIETKKK